MLKSFRDPYVDTANERNDVDFPNAPFYYQESNVERKQTQVNKKLCKCALYEYQNMITSSEVRYKLEISRWSILSKSPPNELLFSVGIGLEANESDLIINQ